MGLDMYLEGECYFWTNFQNPEKTLSVDGFRKKTEILQLGYWRKHPDLHGYIVQEFAGGVDECQKIELSTDDIIKIMAAIKTKSLPKTSGFFFGESEGSEDQESIEIFEKALDWLKTEINEPVKVSKSIHYRASW